MLETIDLNALDDVHGGAMRRDGMPPVPPAGGGPGFWDRDRGIERPGQWQRSPDGDPTGQRQRGFGPSTDQKMVWPPHMLDRPRRERGI
jgi:hypothetical protein